MTQPVTGAQRNTALKLLTTAMAILRDDHPFDRALEIFGQNVAATPLRGTVGTEYSFQNPAFPRTQITLFVTADPVARTANRMKVKQVPRVFTIRFNPVIVGIPRSTLEDLFPLDIGYWIDGDGNQQPGNEMRPVPQHVLLHHYRYRASHQPTSRFPVDVDLTFGHPNPQHGEHDAQKTPVLTDVLLTRDYFKQTPKRRKLNPD
ncbi:hypothetical protein [Paraburkholderia sp.]|uniref:hypothetical protein n=1 Tax=Paraburkholderia sp. TaxID=1926495 RepID=UPI002F42E8DD